MSFFVSRKNNARLQSARGGQARQRRTSPPEADKPARGGQARQRRTSPPEADQRRTSPPEADKPARGGQGFDSPHLGAVKMVSD